MKYTRREFLQLAGALSCSLLVMPACTRHSGSWHRVLSDDEAQCLTALCEQIIPADETDGGATDANVVNFIDKQLSTRFAKQLPDYRNGIAALQATCQSLYKKNFQQLSPEVQIDLMERMERNELPKELWETIRPSNFFRMVIRNTMQGFYGSPRHGGNRNYVSYRMLKLDFPLVIGQNRYTK